MPSERSGRFLCFVCALQRGEGVEGKRREKEGGEVHFCQLFKHFTAGTCGLKTPPPALAASWLPHSIRVRMGFFVCESHGILSGPQFEVTMGQLARHTPPPPPQSTAELRFPDTGGPVSLLPPGPVHRLPTTTGCLLLRAKSTKRMRIEAPFIHGEGSPCILILSPTSPAPPCPTHTHTVPHASALREGRAAAFSTNKVPSFLQILQKRKNKIQRGGGQEGKQACFPSFTN